MRTYHHAYEAGNFSTGPREASRQPPPGAVLTGHGSLPERNEDIVNAFNEKNGVTRDERQGLLQLFRETGRPPLQRLIGQYISSMNQDRDAAWLEHKPRRPEVIRESLPARVDRTFDMVGIGGMFSYLNILYQAHKQPGRYSIITNPHDIFTFSGWTIHPEEDMDQRLIEMFRTKPMLLGEGRRLTGLAPGPRDLRFKSFKIDYGSALSLLKADPGELLKVIKVAVRYVAYEFMDTENRYARTNLERNAETIKALEEMGLVGTDPDHDVINLCGRVVFELVSEARIAAKARLKEEFGLAGRPLAPEELEEHYGDSLDIANAIHSGTLEAVRYPGGYFLAGFKDNALEAARSLGVHVYDDSVVTRIAIDPASQRHAVTLKTSDGTESTLVTPTVLMSLGGYGRDVIPVDGISTLFAIRTENERYRLHPTGMGEGGTIHIVPVWTSKTEEEGRTFHFHLGKATNGAVMGRDPRKPKSLRMDKDFLLHLETHLKRILPRDGRLVWLAATECGRPVSAKQGYTVNLLQIGGDGAQALKSARWRDNDGTGPREAKPGHASPQSPSTRPSDPKSFEATGGCGLGGNTAIIPEVQRILDRQPREPSRSRP